MTSGSTQNSQAPQTPESVAMFCPGNPECDFDGEHPVVREIPGGVRLRCPKCRREFDHVVSGAF